MNLAEQIAEKKAELALLEQRVEYANCVDLGHKWKFVGGCNAGCDKDCSCSVSVHQCRRCGISDYGANDEADEIRRHCAETRESN